MKKRIGIWVSFATSIALALAAFAGTPTSFTVTPSAGANGSITPNTPQLVAPGQTAALTVTPNAGFVTLMKGSCGGTLSAATYTTQPVTANCSVIATFSDVVFANNFEIPPQSTTTTIISTGSSVVGQNYSISAVVTAASGTPDGTVSVTDDAAPANICGPAVLASNVASCSIAWSAPGSYALNAVYSPGASGAYLASASAAVVHVVSKGNTTISVTPSAGTVLVGSQYTANVSVAASSPASGIASGSVAVIDGMGNSCSIVTLDGTGSGSCVLNAPTVASTPTITATYAGDTQFNGGSGTSSVNAVLPPPTVSLSSNANPSSFGQSVTFTATLSQAPQTPGTVAFTDAGVAIGGCGSQSVVGTIATCTIATLAVTTHPVVATFTDTSNYTTSSNTVSQMVASASTTVSVSSNITPAVSGQTVTFTATIAVTAPGAGTPTGSVAFFDNGVAIGACSAQAISAGTATCVVGTLSTGMHSITATYSGDVNFQSSTSSAANQVVNKASTTVALMGSGSPTVFGQSVTFTATVNVTAPGSGAPSGTVTFFDGAIGIGGCANQSVTSNVATCATSALSIGSSPHSITAVYGGDSNFNSSSPSNTVNQTINKAATTTTLTSGNNPSFFGQSVTFTATVTATAPGGGTPTGAMTFKDGANTIALCSSQTMYGGVATCTTSALSVGSHSITAAYSSDGNFQTSTSNTVNQLVNEAQTQTSISGPFSAVYGQSVTFTAPISVTPPGSGPPTGTVTFKDGASTIAGCSSQGISDGLATCVTSAPSAGNHFITAIYNDTDGNFSTSTSGSHFLSVNKAQTNISVSDNTGGGARFGQSVALTATIVVSAPGSGSPTGTVSFTDGLSGPVIPFCGAQSVAGGVATCMTSALSLGFHQIYATYSGDSNFAGNNFSPSDLVNVVQAQTTVSIVSSSNPSTFGQSLAFIATVSVTAPGSGTPTGTVSFTDGGTAITCSNQGQTLGSGVAICVTSALSGGFHDIEARYNGDANFQSNFNIANVFQNVNPATTTTSISSNINPSTVGQSLTFTATVNATPPVLGTLTGTVNFFGISSCSAQSISGGVATCVTSALSSGAHFITASYGGNSNFSFSNSSSLIQTVN